MLQPTAPRLPYAKLAKFSTRPPWVVVRPLNVVVKGHVGKERAEQETGVGVNEEKNY